MRSLTQALAQALGPVGHRIRVRDADLDVPGAAFWFQGMYVIETEGDLARDDNLGSRAFTPTWTGTSWSLGESLPEMNVRSRTISCRLARKASADRNDTGAKR